jgi:dienelactone hydrolase
MKAQKLLILTYTLLLIFCYTQISTAQQVVAFKVPGMEDVIVKKNISYMSSGDSALKMDIYYPPKFDFKSKIPAVVIIYGYSNKAQIKLTGNQLRKWSWYISFCKIIAASGMAAIAYETVDPVTDLVALAEYIKSNSDKLQIDVNRIGAYSCSANTPTAMAYILNTSNSFFKCAVNYYGLILTENYKYQSKIDTLSMQMGFSTPKIPEPASWKKDVPILIVTAGKDYVPYINPSNVDFVAKAIAQNLPVTLINYPAGQHGFDALDNNETTRLIIENTLEFWKFHLKL